MAANQSFISRFFRGAWRFIDGTRKVLLNLIFLFFLYILFIVLVDSGETLVIQPDTALLLQPYGDVVEQYSGTPLDYILQQATEAPRLETRLRDLVEAVRRASDDPSIVRLVIDPNYMRRIGLASLLELESAIADFKASGKPVVALVDNLGQQQYFLASLAYTSMICLMVSAAFFTPFPTASSKLFSELAISSITFNTAISICFIMKK